jgi:DNA-binding transcriptional LysR family regulator
MNLYQIDLNLLVIFDALYRHRSVSRAASEICISQSAFSHGLTRLRKRLNDELFIRVNNQMQPSFKAQQMALQLEKALPLIYSALNQHSVFDAATDETEFTFVGTDYTEFSLLPRLIGQLTKQAPKVKVNVLPTQPEPLDLLQSQVVDFALGFSHQEEKTPTLDRLTWLQDSYCTIARQGHPALKKGLTLALFLSLSHVRISPWGESQGIVDQVLAKNKLTRNVTLQLPSVLVAPYTVANSDLLLTLPRIIAKQFASQIDIALYEPPLELPGYQLNMYWHKVNSAKASYQWIRQQIKQLEWDLS